MKSLVITLILLSSLNLAFADTFVVTTNADSGPGSLREALAAANANGSASPDQIVFDISDQTEAGRTIVLQSQLPKLSSSLTIDASGQPGPAFGVSSAKVRIQHGGSTLFGWGFVIDGLSDVSVYSISFYDFRYGPTSDWRWGAIYMPGINTRIEIGAPGKGNVFYRSNAAILNRYDYTSNWGDTLIDVRIRSNFIGLNEDGITISPLTYNAVNLNSFENLSFGGPDPADGNFVSTYSEEMVYFNPDRATGNGFLKIQNNYFGLDYSKTRPLSAGKIVIEGLTRANWNEYADIPVLIENNYFNRVPFFAVNSCGSGFEIRNIKGFLTIRGNKFNEQVNYSACTGYSIFISQCENGLIGGLNAGDENIFTYANSAAVRVYESRGIQILRNSFYCNSIGIQAFSTKTEIPIASIMSANDVDRVGGKAPPMSRVEAFETPTCTGCNNGKIFLGETYADANGDWEINAPYSSPVTARATIPGGATGEFSRPKLDYNQVRYKSPSCDKDNGYIRGIKVVYGSKYYWRRYSGGVVDTIFNQLDLENLAPGTYSFIVEQTKGCIDRYDIYLNNLKPVINDDYVRVTHPSCGLANGAIRNVSISGGYDKSYWLNENRDTISSITQAPAGRYKLIAMNIAGGCGDSTDYITLTNQAGPSLNTANIITPASCGMPNGSITGITAMNVTGSATVQWIDDKGRVVGTNLDLLNVTAGLYKLRFKDNTNCPAIETLFTVGETFKPVEIDLRNILISPSQCLKNTGAVNSAIAANADEYKWYDAQGAIVSNNLNLQGVSAGKYVLFAKNQYCNQKSDSVSIPLNPVLQFNNPLQVQKQDATCGNSTGFYRILNFPDENQYNFKWIDSSRAGYPIVSTSINLENIKEGRFTLIATTANGCEQKVTTVQFVTAAPPILESSSVVIQNDECGNGIGTIKGINLAGGTGTSPFTYQWVNDISQVVSRSKDATGLKEGMYRLTIKDGYGCEASAGPFKISDRTNLLKAPVYDPQIIPRHTPTTISPGRREQVTYLLYESPTAQPVERNTTGIFLLDTLHADKIFYLQVTNGTCISPMSAVSIKVVDETKVRMPNAFTPNGDGKNDQFKPTVIGVMKSIEFNIYDRWGNRIFQSGDLSDGWNGTMAGQNSPTGNYVWTLTGTDIFGKKIQEKGSFVLIR